MTGRASSEIERLRAEIDEFFYLLPEAMVEIDFTRQRLTRINYRAQVLTGYTQDDVDGGLSAVQLIDAPSALLLGKRLMQDRADSEGQGRPYRRIGNQQLFELTFVRKGGTTFPGEAQAIYLLNDDGIITGVRALFRDITERKQNEAALRESAALLDTTFSSITDSIIIVDRDRRILAFNRAAADMLMALYGTTPETGADLTAATGDSGTLLREHHRQALQGETVRCEQRCEPGQGTGPSIWYDYVYTPMRIDEEISGVAIVARDVTRRKQDEEERLAMERRMQESQRLESLGLLAGGIAHDFNNLLTAIIGNTELALETAVLPDVIDLLQNARTAEREAGRLVAQLLDYSSARATPESATSIDLNALVQDVLDLTQALVQPGITTDLHLASSLPRVEGNATGLRQVVMNLVINAIEAINEPPGRLQIRTWQAGSSATLPSGTYTAGNPVDQSWCILTVQDSGNGIPSATVARIFDPFFTTKPTGRGLGLAAASGIVRMHGGLMIVDSTLGEGSAFSLCLPSV